MRKRLPSTSLVGRPLEARVSVAVAELVELSLRAIEVCDLDGGRQTAAQTQRHDRVLPSSLTRSGDQQCARHDHNHFRQSQAHYKVGKAVTISLNRARVGGPPKRR
jgi:hypothetical protein